MNDIQIVLKQCPRGVVGISSTVYGIVQCQWGKRMRESEDWEWKLLAGSGLHRPNSSRQATRKNRPRPL